MVIHISLDLNHFNTTNVQYMNKMFKDCSKLEVLNFMLKVTSKEFYDSEVDLVFKVPNNFVHNINTKIPLYIYNKINYSISFTRSFKYL